MFVIATLWNRAGHYIFILWFRLSSIFLFFLAYSQPSQIGCVPYFHTWCGLSANLGCRTETCCIMRLAENTYLHHMSAQHGELQPTSGWDRFVSLGHPSKLQRFRLLPSLLQRCCSTEVSQTLHDVWPSPGLVHSPWWNFERCRIHFASKSCTLLYWQCYCTALQ